MESSRIYEPLLALRNTSYQLIDLTSHFCQNICSSQKNERNQFTSGTKFKAEVLPKKFWTFFNIESKILRRFSQVYETHIHQNELLEAPDPYCLFTSLCDCSTTGNKTSTIFGSLTYAHRCFTHRLVAAGCQCPFVGKSENNS